MGSRSSTLPPLNTDDAWTDRWVNTLAPSLVTVIERLARSIAIQPAEAKGNRLEAFKALDPCPIMTCIHTLYTISHDGVTDHHTDARMHMPLDNSLFLALVRDSLLALVEHVVEGTDDRDAYPLVRTIATSTDGTPVFRDAYKSETKDRIREHVRASITEEAVRPLIHTVLVRSTQAWQNAVYGKAEETWHALVEQATAMSETWTLTEAIHMSRSASLFMADEDRGRDPEFWEHPPALSAEHGGHATSLMAEHVFSMRPTEGHAGAGTRDTAVGWRIKDTSPPANGARKGMMRYVWLDSATVLGTDPAMADAQKERQVAIVLLIAGFLRCMHATSCDDERTRSLPSMRRWVSLTLDERFRAIEPRLKREDFHLCLHKAVVMHMKDPRCIPVVGSRAPWWRESGKFVGYDWGSGRPDAFREDVIPPAEGTVTATMIMG